MFNVMLIYDLLEVPLGGLHLHSISLAGGWQGFFLLISYLLVAEKLKHRQIPLSDAVMPHEVPACPSVSQKDEQRSL